MSNTPNRKLPLASVFHHSAGYQCPILLVDAILSKRLGKTLARSLRPCTHHDPRGSPPQAMHGRQFRIDPSQLMNKGVLQELTTPGQGGQSGRLGHGPHIVISEQHRETQGNCGLEPRRSVPGKDLTGAQCVGFRDDSTVQSNLLLSNATLPLSKRRPSVTLGQEFENGLPRRIGRHHPLVHMPAVEPASIHRSFDLAVARMSQRLIGRELATVFTGNARWAWTLR